MIALLIELIERNIYMIIKFQADPSNRILETTERIKRKSSSIPSLIKIRSTYRI